MSKMQNSNNIAAESVHAHTHSDIGFQLTQFPTGNKARERQGEGVGATVLFEQSVDMSAVANISAAQLQETRQKRGLREVACEQP